MLKINEEDQDRIPRLSMVDTTLIWKESNAQEVLKQSLKLAEEADRLGYTRYWFSEHHNTHYYAGSAPELLAAQIPAITSQIKVGTANLMLPHQSALKVVENFRTLEGVYPGRIDLGIALTTGSDLLAARALHRTHDVISSEEFQEQLAALLDYLTDSYETNHVKITASPHVATIPEVWIRETNHDSVRYAAEYGIGLVYDYRGSPSVAAKVIQSYREFFQPSLFFEKAKSILIVSVLCADSDEEAMALSKPVDMWDVRKEQGMSPPSIEEARYVALSQQQEQLISTSRTKRLIGSPSKVGADLRRLAKETAADEMMILTVHPSIEVRRKSMQLLAKEFNLTSNQRKGVENHA